MEPQGELGSLSQRVLEASPRGDMIQIAHNSASSSADWSPPGPDKVGMLHGTGTPCSSRCSKVATLGTTSRAPLSGVTASPQPRQEPARHTSCLTGPPEQQKLPTNSWSLHAGTCQPQAVSLYCGERAAAALLHPSPPTDWLLWAGGITQARAGTSLDTLAPGMSLLPQEGTHCKEAARSTGAGGDLDPSQESLAGSE